MNADGDAIVLATNENGGNVIKPCEGIFVVVGADDPETYPYAIPGTPTITAKIWFTTTEPEPSSSKGLLDIKVSHDNRLSDVARVRFGEGDRIGKLVLRDEATRLSFSQDGKEYSVVTVVKDEKSIPTEPPVNFKAKENGTYTLTIADLVIAREERPKQSNQTSFSYLHLIDNLTGNDVDLLVNPSYTFESRTSDYESRFKLVFILNEDNYNNQNNNDDFAFISNGELIVTSSGTLHVFDALGRQLFSKDLYLPSVGEGLRRSVFRFPFSVLRFPFSVSPFKISHHLQGLRKHVDVLHIDVLKHGLDFIDLTEMNQ